MGTIATNLLPNATGLDLGSPSQRFDIFAKDLTADAITSNSPNAATTGEINLASTDTIAWRNAANSADVLLAKSQAAGALPADTLTWPNGVQAAEYITATLNPATVGILRLAKTDTVNFRNNANSLDLNALDLNNDDSLTVGDVAGIKAAIISSTGGVFESPSGHDIVVEPQGTSGNSVNLTASDGTGVTGGAVNILAGSATGANGGTVTITGGNSDTSATGGDISLVPGTGASSQGAVFLNGTVTVANKITSYNGVTTGGNGIASIVAVVNLTAQTAASSGTLYAVPANGAGQYRLSWNAKVTTAATGAATSTLGPLTLGWSDPDAVVIGTTGQAAQISAGTMATTNATNSITSTGMLLGTSCLLNVGNSTNIVWNMAYASNAANSMAYNLHLRLEYLG